MQTKGQRRATNEVFREILGEPPTKEEAARIKRLLRKRQGGKQKGKD